VSAKRGHVPFCILRQTENVLEAEGT
jgi:hypothetical protein